MRIGGYEVLGEVGRGGMGVVYRVRTPDGREAALKLLVMADAATFARFERERRLLASFGESEGFVELLDSGTSGDGAWLVMPFVPGGTLRQRLEAGPLGVEETIALGKELARALGVAHERGIVHRDVKPENVLFTASGRALLTDLGLAKHFDRLAKGASQSVSLSQHGTFKGTAGYMAPEQLDDARTAGPQADVFALGAVLYECLAGRPAFHGDSVLDVIARMTSGSLERMGRPGVPEWLEAIVVRALAPDPRARFVTGAALARALGSRDAKPTPPRRGALLLLGGALVVAAGIVLGVLGASGGEKRAPGKPIVPPARPPAPSVAPRLSARELVERALAKANAADWDGEMADCNAAIALDPTLASAWANRGVARGNRGDFDGEIADCTRAIELDPELATAYANRAYAHEKKGDREREIADCTKAIELDPKLSQAWANRGVARQNKGDRDGAIADYTRALEIDARLGIAWANRGVARGENGDLDGEIADCTKAIELDPTVATDWQNRGVARLGKGDLDGAIADCTKAIELDPTHAVDWWNRAFARLKKGDWDGVIADSTKAIELDPGLAEAWGGRGYAHGQKGEPDLAIADSTRAIELDPKHVGAWSSRGTARCDKHDWKGGIADLEHALELDPGLPGAPQVQAALEEAKKRAAEDSKDGPLK